MPELDRESIGRWLLNNEDKRGSEDFELMTTAWSSLSTPTEPVLGDEEASAWEQFKYSFDKAGSLTSYAGDIIEKYAPLGRLAFQGGSLMYFSPAATYGEEFADASPEERRELIFQNHQAFLDQKYGEDMQASGAPAFLGEVAKGILDPTTLIPLGAGYKTMAATSAALGGAWSMAEDIATVGEVDPLKALTVAAASGVLAPATVAGARALYNPIKTRAAQRVMGEAQEALNDRAARGYIIDDIPTALKEEGVDLIKVTKAQQQLDTSLTVPPPSDPIAIATQKAVVEDSAVSRLYSPALDKYLGAMSTRVRNISEAVLGRMRKFEFDTHVNTHKRLDAVHPFSAGLAKLPVRIKEAVGRHLYNGDFKAAQGLMRATSRDLADNFDVVVRELNDVGDQLVSSGHLFEKVENYFPRLVKNVEGLLNSLGKEKQSIISKTIADFAKAKNISPSNVSIEDKAEIIDLIVRGYRATTDGGKPRFLKPRTIEAVSPDQMQFYATPEESLSYYMSSAVNNIEKRKFFGRSAETTAGKFDPQASIGRFIAEEIDRGVIPIDKQDELADLLTSRFVTGEQSSSSGISLIRNLGYLGTIANPVSAVTQLGDLGIVAARQGFKNTVKSTFGAKDVKLVDIGIDQVISQEFSDVGIAARALNKAFTISGFRSIDKLGKETLINAALKKNTGLVKNPKGIEALRSKWGNVFGEEFDSLVTDLSRGDITDNVKFLLFNELSDVQPITLMEMPQAYLDNPNGRVLYMLKSFTLKQYDIARREVVQEWTKGNKMEAVKNATRLAGYMTAANLSTTLIKDIMQGREIPPENLPGEAMWALLGVYGMNEYTNERYLKRGDFKGAAINQLVPATPIIDAAFTLATELPKDDPNIARTLRAVPLVGPLVYAWFGGGAELYNERLKEK